MKKNIIGDGLCAAGALLGCNVKKDDYQIFLSNTTGADFEKVSTNWRLSPIISSKAFGGLSKSYHGIMPASVILDINNSPIWRALGYEKLRKLYIADYMSESKIFIPYFPIRPGQIIKKFSNPSKISRRENLDLKALINDKNSKTFLALSVIGNLRVLQSLNLINKKVTVDDHVIIRMGSIGGEELFEYLNGEELVKRFSKGIAIESLEISTGCTIFFRPNFGEYNFDIDYTASVNGLGKLFMKFDSPAKIREAFFNKTGYPTRHNSYNIFAQIHMPDIYSMEGGIVTESVDSQAKFYEIKLKVLNLITRKFNTFKVYKNDSPESILPGIHLSYDREVISGIPRNLEILDTSLCNDNSKHPSIIAMCKSFHKTILL
ncbi:hypothetical protein [Polynucleobacter sp. Adler-ghost]|uniref:hypothetical protein n=1 Tax=Polynucleobacter sp. Adler-ghost TaxID=2770234 RepID=UPI001BFE42D3|nr:hypothetical protein [Polynucleobacter sp. Adler-ghost]QWE31064.1 hypothetical protein ICV89_01710 [Polynucleobacter sp. Adler-ghost]